MTHNVSRLILAIASAVLVSPAMTASAGTISGTVTNALNGHPIENVEVELSAAIKAIAGTTTNTNGYYEFNGVEAGQDYMITFSCREFVPGTLSPVASDATGADIALNPVGVFKPKKPIVYSGPKSVYMEWFANPEYNLKGYYVWRAITVEAPSPSELAQALANAVKVSGLIPAGTTEYIDESVQPSEFYVYQIQALSAADRPSSLSDASENPVKAQFLKLFLPEISVNRDLSGLFLWDLTPDDLNQDKWVRIPVSSECAYEVSTFGIDIKVDLPNNLIVADSTDDIQVMPTGITEGMTPFANVYQELPDQNIKTLSISSIDSGGRLLYGTGVLFDVYAKLREGAFDDVCNPLGLVKDEWDGHSGRMGTTLYDIVPELIPLEVRDGQLCVNQNLCIHGDVDQNETVDQADAQAITDIKVGLRGTANLTCFPGSADINQDTRVDSADASMILQWVKNGAINPPPGVGKSAEERKSASFAAWDEKDAAPEVGIGEIAGAPSELVSADITLTSEETGLPTSGYTAVVAYPAGDGGVTFESCVIGEALSDYHFSYKDSVTNEYFGKIELSASNDAELATKGTAVLATVTFRIGANTPQGPVPVKLRSFESNDPYGYTPRHGAPGQATIVELEATQYTVTLAAVGEGTITPGVGPHTYQGGSVVNLLAEPAQGWRFDHWEGAVAAEGAPETSAVVNGNMAITAVFEQEEDEGEGEGSKFFICAAGQRMDTGSGFGDALLVVGLFALLAVGRLTSTHPTS